MRSFEILLKDVQAPCCRIESIWACVKGPVIVPRFNTYQPSDSITISSMPTKSNHSVRLPALQLVANSAQLFLDSRTRPVEAIKALVLGFHLLDLLIAVCRNFTKGVVLFLLGLNKVSHVR